MCIKLLHRHSLCGRQVETGRVSSPPAPTVVTRREAPPRRTVSVTAHMRARVRMRAQIHTGMCEKRRLLATKFKFLHDTAAVALRCRVVEFSPAESRAR